MINVELGTFFALLILLIVAGFGYYRAFLTLITRRARLTETRNLSGLPALLLGVVYLAGAIAVSGVAVLFYFSIN
jgi:hypothetical protein